MSSVSFKNNGYNTGVIKMNDKIKIAPNPASTELKISLDNNNTNCKIIDMFGRTLETLSFDKSSKGIVNISKYANGTYFIVSPNSSISFNINH